MKIGNRTFTSFTDFLIQFQDYAMEHPWKATADLLTVAAVILIIDYVV